MRTAGQWLEEYGDSHRNHTNKMLRIERSASVPLWLLADVYRRLAIRF